MGPRTPTARASTVEPALALVELSSIAAGVQAATMPSIALKAGTVHTKSGTRRRQVADVEGVARRRTGSTNRRSAARAPAATDALGIVETTTVAAAILAADAGVKGARVRLVELRLADGLGGKGVVLFSGLVADVEAAVRLATGALERPELLVREVVIPQLHPGLWENVGESTWFGSQVMGKL
jgi:microcompartment protein CcmL/EutN